MNVLVPINNLDSARMAVEHSIREYPDASITVLHVLNPGLSTFNGGGMYSYGPILEARWDSAEELFAAATETADNHCGSITTRTVVGDPAREIVAFADDHDSDHIVVGSCGRSGMSRVLLGSVSERVFRRAAVPVTVVR